MNIKFLIVDDSRAMQTIVQRVIEQIGYRQHEFRTASDGLEALDIIQAWHPDLVLSDWHMPTMTGLELMHQIQNLQLNTQVGLVTTERSIQAIRDAKDAGALFVIHKPFSSSTLRKALEPALKGLPMAAVSGAAELAPGLPHLLLPSATALAKLLSVITSAEIRIDDTDPISATRLELPIAIALFGDTLNRTRAVALLEHPLTEALADSIGAGMFGEDSSTSNRQSALNIAFKLFSTTFRDVEEERDLDFLRASSIPNVISKLHSVDQLNEQERRDFNIVIGDCSGHCIFFVEDH